jgi:FKBP-type peptidyl-prolyl cis-trans isomerase FkpA
MSRTWGALILAAAVVSAACSGGDEDVRAAGSASPAAPAANAAAGTDEDKTLYAMGAVLGQNVKNLSLTPAQLEHVRAGFMDVAAGKAEAVDMQTYGPKIQAFVGSRRTAAAQVEKDKGKAFATKFAGEGGQALPSGLVLKTVQEGTGAMPKPTDTVRVHYTGKLTDGTEFDSSVKRGQPAEFPLNGVIPCWTEGVQKMKVGGKAQLVCPSDIAYGDGGRPPQIPGGATLVFDVELLGIGAAKATPAVE